MTVNTTSITSGPYTGNGVTTSFPYTFKAFTDANVIVYQTVGTSQSTLTLGTHYSVTGTGIDGGGNVVMVTAPASGDEIYIRSNYSAEQLTDFDSQGGFYPDTHEDAFDKQTMLIQQLEDVQGRGLRLPLSDSNGVMPELSPDPLKLLRWNAAGDAVENVDITLIDPDAVATDILVYTVETFAALATTPATTAGMVVYLKQHTSGGIGGGHFQDTAGTITNNGGTLINNTATAGRHWKRLADSVNVEQFGALGYPTDDSTAIQAAIDAFPLGKKVHFTLPKYKYTSTIYLKYQGIFLVGNGVFATNLVYVNVSGGTSLKANSGTAIINGAGFSGLNFTCDSAATAPDITVDFSGFSYCTFDDFEINNTRASGICMKGYSDLGTAPYYNSFTRFRLFGSGYTQTGILMTDGAWGGGSRGPNANIFSGLMRAAGLARVFDIKEGQGNLFNNISFESVGDHAIILNDIASYVDNGTATAGGNNSLTDGVKSWTSNAFVNYSVTTTSGAGAGQTRKITTNTATVLNVSPAWGKKIDATTTYSISRLGAFENKFSNLRQEGLDSLNPNFVTCMPGAIGNEISQYSVSSLGSGKTVNDLSGHPSNHLSTGKLTLITEVVENPGASANINIWPKTSVLGGLGISDSYSIEWIQVKCPGIVSGVATITLDCGGVTVGSGSPSLQCVLDSSLVYDAFTASTDKEVKSSLNNGLFLNLTTDASMNASTDFVITVCLAIH